MPRRLLSIAVALAAMAGALGMRAYIGHPVERIIETHTVERIEKETSAVRAKVPTFTSHRRVHQVRKRQPGDDSADELNRAWLRQ